MRKNPLLYSDQNKPQDVYEPEPIQEEPRSFFFYIIILANSLLVLFVLGVIWFLFLKSPDLELKTLTERFFGSSEQPTIVIESPSTAAPVDQSDPKPSKQEQDEVQQARLKQMREQEELAAERTRLEQLKQQLEAEKQRTNTLQSALPLGDGNADTATESTTITITPETKPVIQPEINTSDEPVVIPDAAREIPPEPVHSDDTNSQVDEIMEMLRQQELEKQQQNN